MQWTVFHCFVLQNTYVVQKTHEVIFLVAYQNWIVIINLGDRMMYTDIICHDMISKSYIIFPALIGQKT